MDEVIEKIPVAILILSKDGKIKKYNSLAAIILGIKSRTKELDFSSFLTQASQCDFSHHLKNVFASQKPSTIILNLLNQVDAIRLSSQYLNDSRQYWVSVAKQPKSEIAEPFKYLADNMSSGLFIVENNKVKYYNNQVPEIYGFSSQEMEEISPLNLISPECHDKIIQTIATLKIAQPRFLNLFYWIKHTSGEQRYYHNQFTFIKFNEHLFRYYVILNDFTNLKLESMNMIESEANFRALTENANAGILIANPEGQYIYANRKMKQISGYEINELLQKNIESLVPVEDISKVRLRHQKRMAEEEVPINYEMKVIHKSGKIIPVEVTGTKVNWQGQPGNFIIIQDVTRRKEAEKALRKSEQRYRAIVSDQTEFICRFSPEGVLSFTNPVFNEHYSSSKSSLIGKNLFELFSKSNKSHIENRIQKLNYLQPVQTFALKEQSHPNKVLWVQWTFHALYYTKDEISEIQATGRDITHLKKIETELSQNRDHLEKMVEKRTLALQKAIVKLKQEIVDRKRFENELSIKDFAIESSLNAVVFSSINGKINYVNPAFLKLWGYDNEDEVKDKSILSLFASMRELAAARNEMRENGYWMGELNALRKDGSRRIVHISGNVVHGENDEPVSIMLSVIDTTQQKKMQSQLILSERLAASGQLAAYIAHEINSPLQAIKTMLHTFRSSVGSNDIITDQLNLMEKAFDNIRDIVKNLLDLNRPGNRTKVSLQINTVISDTLSLLKSFLARKKIEMKVDLKTEDCLIWASPQELSQVLLNLINNAVEAIYHNQKPIDSIFEKSFPIGKIKLSTMRQNDHLIIEVSDTGPGLNEIQIEKLFDPFYSKKKSMGMGLGLAICNTIIQEHDGTIEAFNAPEGGAIFKIILPVIKSTKRS